MNLDLEAGMGTPPVEEGDIVLNISRVKEYLRCPARWAQRYLADRVLDSPRNLALPVGDLTHKALERIHNAEPLDLPGLQAELLNQAEGRTPEQHEELAEYATWLGDIAPLYQNLFQQNRWGWKTILSAEQPMWLRLLRMPERGCVYLLGKPDLIVVGQNDKLRHVQLKTVSTRVNQDHFAAQSAFDLHEAVYAEMIEGTYGEQLDMAYSGVDLIMLSKRHKPTPPVNTTKDGRITEAYQRRLDKYEQDLAAWADRVIDRRFLRFTRNWRRNMLTELCDSVFGMIAVSEKVRPPVRAGGGACHYFHNACEYLPVCSGQARLDGPMFRDREPDYVDELTRGPQDPEHEEA